MIFLKAGIEMKEYKAGIYLRLSREHAEENNSIEAQREITTNYAINNGFKIVKEYQDNGYSGILNSRPALNEMMIDISRGIINMVIVKDISRLTRNKNKTGWYTEIFFPDNDVRFISVTEFIDSGERYEIDDTIMLRGIANQYYLTDISKKIIANKKTMKDAGQYVEAHVPYGYKLLEEDKHKIVIDEKVAEVIRLIYDMYIDGKTGMQIAKYLNSKKKRTPSQYLKMKNASTRWSGETINDILSNPFYSGDTVVNKYITNYMTKTCKKNKDRSTWIIKENTHEPIILKEKYKRVQEIKKGKRGKNAIKYEFLLKDLLYCGHCKHKLQYKLYKSADKTRYLYDSSGFVCGIVYKKKYLCKNKTFVNEKHINSIIIEKVKERLSQIKVDKATNKIVDYFKENSEETKELNKYKNEVQKLDRKKMVLYRKKCEQYITENEFKEEYTKIKEEISNYQKKIEKLEKNNNNSINEKRIKEIINEFQKGKDINNEFLKEIINRIEVYSNNQINIIFNL